MISSGVEADRNGPILEVTLDKVERRNALDPRMIQELETIFTASSEDTSLRAILLTGRGSSFCSGFDLTELHSLGEPGAAEIRMVERLATAIGGTPIPVIAALNGPVAGAGCDVALACDVRIGHSGSAFVVPAAKTGLLYGPASTERLVSAFGGSVGSAMLITGEPVDAHRCFHLGVLWSLVEEVELMTYCRDLAHGLARNAPLSVRALKNFARLVQKKSVQNGEDEELRLLEDGVWGSLDAAVGLKAYLDKRPVEFVGR
jgi:enoyl-CoA hydratase/carnithine racemase